MERSVPRARPTTAIVLAGGLGTRMRRPDLPKPLVPVDGKPMIVRVIEGIGRAGYTHAVVVVGHLGDMVRDAVGERCGQVRITWAEQRRPDGTADAVASALPALDGILDRSPGDERCDAALVTFADVLVPATHYALLATAWRLRDVEVLTTVIDGNPSVGALVEIDESLGMTDFVEKPSGVARGTADAGVSVWSRSALSVLADVEQSTRGEKEIATGLQRLLREGVPIGVERLAGPWVDLATPELVAEAEVRLPELLA